MHAVVRRSSVRRADNAALLVFIAPLVAIVSAFLILPLAQLVLVGAGGEQGWSNYYLILSNPRYLASVVSTVVLSVSVTFVTLILSTVSGVFLIRNSFPGKSVITSMLALPLAFPGVVIGFMIIMLGGRLGIVSSITMALFGNRVVFAYSLAGLFIGYVYFSIPRTILTIMAAAEKLDVRLEEAARSLGASSWYVVWDVIVPALKPALIAGGAICFATAMGAIGTVYTLGTRVDVLPLTIYVEFVVQANLVVAASLSFVLGVITWSVLTAARLATGSSIAAAG
jgi:putative spermidine/putrescine transport system permease protein